MKFQNWEDSSGRAALEIDFYAEFGTRLQIRAGFALNSRNGQRREGPVREPVAVVRILRPEMLLRGFLTFVFSLSKHRSCSLKTIIGLTLPVHLIEASSGVSPGSIDSRRLNQLARPPPGPGKHICALGREL
jgi:hypothetical protein